MKRLFKFKHPKIAVMALCILIAYIIFKNPAVAPFINGLGSLSYLGLFIAGMLFAFGFSAPLAVGFFITLNPANIWLAAVIAGFGALTSNLLIFNFIRFSFEDEFNDIKNSNTLKRFSHFLENTLTAKITRYLMYVFAGILIASPLPDEAGVIMLAGLAKIKQLPLAIFTFILSTIGVLIILHI